MGHWKSRCLVNKVDQSELSSQAVNSFCLVIKETCSLTFSWSKIVVFSWLILDNFECLLSVGLNGNRTCWNELSGFPEGAHDRGLSSSPTIYITSPSLEGSLAFGVVGGGSFCLPHDLFHSTLLYSIHFSLPITVLKTFSLCLSRESHAET